MITGNRASAFVLTGDGKTVLGELRACVHCQYMWAYVRGSGRVRGFCACCYGLLCMRAECALEQQRHLAWAQARGWVLTRRCIPFEEWAQRVQDATERHKNGGKVQGVDFAVLPNGLYVPLNHAGGQVRG